MSSSTHTGTAEQYALEADAIAEALSELDAQFKALRARVAEEHPELLKSSTDFGWHGAVTAEHFSHYLRGTEIEYLRSRR